MRRKEFLATIAGIAATLAASGAALAQTTYPNQTPPGQKPPTRGEYGSARNIRRVHQMLERAIDELQHDQRDYGGYRVKAIEALRQAREDLMEALKWDKSHPSK
ncbi:MAG: hypothetical protein E6H00_12275 [Bacillati bacterium ANGP1]|uniref:Twin-arginine translocation signal domain-containing protein n=1 Tax=Candidatus Segetimicrobium genomatis TaxID=2569760 RepID=A0A537JZ43_9BACT|nr:MAG: hypothetical protein E6H00_12275 [Terrabacteria group bacterium ANGP1]